MCIHFESKDAAVSHLTSNGWKLCSTGRFVSHDGCYVVQISPKFDNVVLVQVWSN